MTEVGAMVALTAATLSSAFRGPRDYGPELVAQFRFALKLAWLPLVLSAFAFNFGPMGILASGVLGALGALDRLGSTYVIATVREFAPFVTGIVVAGAIGTAFCADLGARKAREELDALAVLGVDPVKSLVVPRFVAIVTISLLFNSLSLIAGIVGAICVELEHHAPIPPFFASFFAAGSTTELAASFVKACLFGVVIAIVCCYKGMNVSRGAEGVGRAVNQAVVICFLSMGAIDYAFTQLLLATHPALSQVR